MVGFERPGDRGTHSEGAVAAAFARSGSAVFLPAFGSAGRLDLIAVRASGVLRVQCKTACRIGETLRFWTCSNTNNTPVSYAGQIDTFGVFAPDTGLVYVVPVDEVPSRACLLRLAPTLNGQRRNIRWAPDFELGPP